jgi:hypothetical protein
MIATVGCSAVNQECLFFLDFAFTAGKECHETALVRSLRCSRSLAVAGGRSGGLLRLLSAESLHRQGGPEAAPRVRLREGGGTTGASLLPEGLRRLSRGAICAMPMSVTRHPRSGRSAAPPYRLPKPHYDFHTKDPFEA